MCVKQIFSDCFETEKSVSHPALRKIFILFLERKEFTQRPENVDTYLKIKLNFIRDG